MHRYVKALCAAFGYFPALLGVARLTQLLDAVVPGASKMSMGTATTC